MYMRKAIVSPFQQVHIGVVSISPGQDLSQNVRLLVMIHNELSSKTGIRVDTSVTGVVVFSLFTECKRPAQAGPLGHDEHLRFTDQQAMVTSNWADLHPHDTRHSARSRQKRYQQAIDSFYGVLRTLLTRQGVHRIRHPAETSQSTVSLSRKRSSLSMSEASVSIVACGHRFTTCPHKSSLRAC
jgi:hypothetical protein